MPTASETYYRLYCRWNQAKCARFKVASALGTKQVPLDLFPGDSQRADALLLQFNHSSNEDSKSSEPNPCAEIRCWEVMPCDQDSCPARSEEETPCWEIARRDGTFRDIAHPLNSDTRRRMEDQILTRYRSEVSDGHEIESRVLTEGAIPPDAPPPSGPR